MAKRKRRAFTKEFKAQTVRLVRDSGKSMGVLARELDLGEMAIRSWVRQAEIDGGRGRPGALTTDEREKYTRLRQEVRTLRAAPPFVAWVSQSQGLRAAAHAATAGSLTQVSTEPAQDQARLVAS